MKKLRHIRTMASVTSQPAHSDISISLCYIFVAFGSARMESLSVAELPATAREGLMEKFEYFRCHKELVFMMILYCLYAYKIMIARAYYIVHL